MATNITTGKPLCFEAGASGASYVVGYESKQNRVVRYEFRTDGGGASDISVAIHNYSKSADTGSASAPLRFYIGTSPTSHANAGAGSEYLGQLTMTTAGGYYHFTGSAKVVLAPNTTYYLWIFPGSTTYGWWWVASQGTATVTVHTAAMSSMSVGNGTLGQTVPITITRHGSFTHTLWYRHGSENWVQIASGVATSYNWVPPLSMAAYAPSGTSFQVTILCRTYNGSTAVGDVSKTITLTIPDTVVPSVSMSIKDPTGLMLSDGRYLQNLSGVQVTLQETTAYGSPIVSRKITIGSVSGGGTSLTVQPINVSGSVVVSVSVTDARGRTDASSLVIQVEPYTRPTASVSGQRCNADGTPNPAGTYILATYSGSYTDLGGDNTVYPVLYYRKSGDTYWSSQDVQLSGSSVIPADAAYIYELQFAVEDDYADPQKSQIFPVPSAFAGVSLAKNANGVIDGITFGGTAHPGGGFVCELPAQFLQSMRADKDAVFDGRMLINNDIVARNCPGTPGAYGWVPVCRITVTWPYRNQPFAFLVFQRNKTFPSVVSILFANNPGADPAIQSFTYAWSDVRAVLNKVAPGIWDLYILKVEQYDEIDVIGPIWGAYLSNSGISVEQSPVEQTPSLPSTSAEATRASF